MSEPSALLGVARGGALAAVFVAVLAVLYAIASLPAPGVPRLGLSGLQRGRALADSAFWRLVEPLVRWAGRRLEVLLSEAQRTKLRGEIALAGDVAGISPGELAALCLGSALSGLALGGLYSSVYQLGPLAFAAGFAGGAFLPLLELDSRKHERRRRAELGLPQLIDLLRLALSAGLDFPGALRQAIAYTSTPRDALVEELRLILHQLEVGKTRSEALRLFAERLPTPVVREFVAAATQAEQSGSPLAQVLETQAQASRLRRSEQAEEVASRAGVNMVFPLLLGFTSILLLVAAPLVLGILGKLRSF